MQRSRYTHTAKQVFPYSQESTTGSLHKRTTYSFTIDRTISIISIENHIYHWCRTLPIITKVSQHQGETINTFYNRILKLSRQCEFSDPHEHLIDAIIFGTNCVKAQDKLLQTLKMLSLQQCLTVCQHYESLKLHIQQIRPDKHIEFLR